MNKLFHLAFLCLLANLSFGQYNMSLVGTFSPPQNVSDIWGYQAGDGTEYALLGVQDGVYIISLATPSNPTVLHFLGGPTSTWRDLKTHGNYGYVTNETDGGLFIMDLTDPTAATIDTFFYRPQVTVDSVTTELKKAHNVYIDENGYCYIPGSNINGGGVIILDLNASPTAPPIVGIAPRVYAHDVYVRDNIMYTSDIYAGVFTMYDVSDKSNITYMGSNNTPFNFTHNAWISDDGNTLWTTDEKANAPVGSYDVSDPSNIIKLDEARPNATVDLGVIPHNVHVKNDFIVTSYYSDGVVVFDGAKPDNLVEVGHYDTWLGADGGFNGCWGAYPFLPSGLVLGSDRSTGLYVLQPSYVRASYLEGLITDFDTGDPLDDAMVEIVSTPVSELSAMDGSYKTGYGIAGTYDILVSRPGYASQTLSATLVSGQVTTLDVALISLDAFKLKGTVKDKVTGLALPFAKINIGNDDYYYELTADNSGNFDVDNFVGGFYDIYSAVWGYNTVYLQEESISQGPTPFIIELSPGYEDVFELDLEWIATGTSTDGTWERGEPVGTYTDINEQANPELDVPTDIGSQCYVTKNAGGPTQDDDVDGGSSILLSPVFDISNLNEPTLSYRAWYFREGASSVTTDRMEVILSNGTDEVVLEEITDSKSIWRAAQFINIPNSITPTATMTIRFEISDEGDDDIVEGGVDRFYVYDANPPSSIQPIKAAQFTLQIAPNPSSDQFLVDFELKDWNGSPASILLYNSIGQVVESQVIDTKTGQLSLGEVQPTGLYFIQVATNDSRSRPFKVIKTK